jgi:hypothetical protein
MYLGLLFFLVNNNDSNCCYKQHVPPLLRVHVYIFNFFSRPCKPSPLLVTRPSKRKCVEMILLNAWAPQITW